MGKLHELFPIPNQTLILELIIVCSLIKIQRTQLLGHTGMRINYNTPVRICEFFIRCLKHSNFKMCAANPKRFETASLFTHLKGPKLNSLTTAQ